MDAVVSGPWDVVACRGGCWTFDPRLAQCHYGVKWCSANTCHTNTVCCLQSCTITAQRPASVGHLARADISVIMCGPRFISWAAMCSKCFVCRFQCENHVTESFISIHFLLSVVAIRCLVDIVYLESFRMSTICDSVLWLMENHSKHSQIITAMTSVPWSLAAIVIQRHNCSVFVMVFGF